MTLLEITAIAEVEGPHPGDHPSPQADVLRFTGSLIAGPAAADNGDGTFAPSVDSRTVSPCGWTWETSAPRRPSIVTEDDERDPAGVVGAKVAPAYRIVAGFELTSPARVSFHTSGMVSDLAIRKPVNDAQEEV